MMGVAVGEFVGWWESCIWVVGREAQERGMVSFEGGGDILCMPVVCQSKIVAIAENALRKYALTYRLDHIVLQVRWNT